MKINKDAARAAKDLFRLSFVDGRLDEGRVKKIVKRIVSEKPRNHSGILHGYHRLLRLEVEKRHVVVESAEALGDDLKKDVSAGLNKQYDASLSVDYNVNPELIGGMRVRVGSDVWDGSVKAKLGRLADKL